MNRKIDPSKHIKEILQERNSVILPGIGGFTAKYQNAKYYSRTGKFLPPSKKVIFNAYLNYEDHVLSTFIQQSYPDVSKEEANQIVVDYCSETKKRLNDKKKVRIEGLGILKRNERGVLTFEPHVQDNLLLDSFGMDALRIDPVEKDSKVSIEKEHNTYSTSSKWRPLYIGLLILVIIAVTAAFSVVFFTEEVSGILQKVESVFKGKNSTETNNEGAGYKLGQFRDDAQFAGDVKDSVREADTAVSRDIAVKLDQQTRKERALYYEEGNDYPGKTKYYIIAGSFNNHENAELLQKQLGNRGYSSEIMEEDDELFRVTMAVYANKRKALKSLEKIKSAEKKINPWILSK
jgi:nucleoid DNA-binding protein